MTQGLSTHTQAEVPWTRRARLAGTASAVWRTPRFRQILTVVVGVAVGVVIWAVAAHTLDDDVLLPSPALTIDTWVHYLHTPYPEVNVTLPMHALYSTMRILIGFAAGTALGMAIGALMAATRVLRNLLDPLIEATRPVPAIAFIPVLIVWFGIGEVPKITLIMMAVVPIMAVTTVAALDRVPQEMIHAARCLGGSSAYAMLHVRLRGAVTPLITGMRLAMGVGWTCVVAAEMIVAEHGLGYMILQAGLYLDMSIIFAGIFTIAMLGVGCDLILRWLQRAFDPTVGAQR